MWVTALGWSKHRPANPGLAHERRLSDGDKPNNFGSLSFFSFLNHLIYYWFANLILPNDNGVILGQILTNAFVVYFFPWISIYYFIFESLLRGER